MFKAVELGLDQPEKMCKVAKALASETRIEIIKLLNGASLNINEISEKLSIPASSAALNVKVLEEAGIIHTELHPGVRGAMKLCSLSRNIIKFTITGMPESDYNIETIDMPIGNFVECQITPTCGIVSDKAFIGAEDDVRSFYHPQRSQAQLIWFHTGYLRYYFSNECATNNSVRSIDISMEICSEAPNYKNDWPSDITLWINEVECATWTSPGDFGGRRGKLNPPFWSDGSTQYGELKHFTVTADGCRIDGEKVSDICLKDLNLEQGNYIDVKIGVKEDAVNAAGINLFGEKFGDYKQNITLRMEYK